MRIRIGPPFGYKNSDKKIEKENFFSQKSFFLSSFSKLHNFVSFIPLPSTWLHFYLMHFIAPHVHQPACRTFLANAAQQHTDDRIVYLFALTHAGYELEECFVWIVSVSLSLSHPFSLSPPFLFSSFLF